MHRNVFWLAFLLIIVVSAAWFSIKATYALFDYYSYTLTVPVEVERWEVRELKQNNYIVVATFKFSIENQSFTATGPVGEVFPNNYAAASALKQYQEESWTAWVNPAIPEEATLNRFFPWKSTLSAIVLVALFLYFLALGRYVAVKGGRK